MLCRPTGHPLSSDSPIPRLFEAEAENVAALLGVRPLLADTAVSTRIPSTWRACETGLAPSPAETTWQGSGTRSSTQARDPPC